MSEPLQVNPADVRSLGDIHADVAGGLGSLTASSPGAGAVAGSHGTIASAVGTALTDALGSRSGTIATAQSTGSIISELLHQSALAYERGDQRGGDAMRTAADALARGEGPAGGTPSGGGGADPLGQAVGQMGQLGQIGQQLAAPLAALAQPLQQLPQQIMQGLAQMSQSGSGAGTSDVPQTPAPDPAEDDARDEPSEEQDPKDDDGRPDAVEENASPGAPAVAGPAPMPPADERPAPTRPAVG
ncbi:ESX-1 secretion-associated protein [Mycobacterium sp. ITM-2017-0098]|nr:ESX-1 secretion-associated protein [Mycobacterium sp. ITM-2017-0098]